jgi:hypothetical protein
VTTETVTVEPDAGTDFLNREVQGATDFLTHTEVAILRDRHDLAYTVNGGPARPPTDEEAAAYAARHGDPNWADIYNPAPRLIMPVRPVEPAPRHLTAVRGPAADETLRQHQQASDADLGRWTAGKSLVGDPAADRAATRFIDAFSEDPEGDADRAELRPLPDRSDDA